MFSLKRLGKRIVGHPDPVPVVSTKDWVSGHTIDLRQQAIDYVVRLFPLFTWLPRYNRGWFSGDVIAGLTVGMVIVPQSMAYAHLATLPPEYGLYSSFVGVLVYCFFATSKDVSIGPVTVMSLVVAQIVRHVQDQHPHKWTGPVIASALSLVCGFIVLFIGLLRLGWIVEFIPAPAISGFMTGSAITIVSSQLPFFTGITGFDPTAAAYKVIINTLMGLHRAKLDTVFGLAGLVSLYGIRLICDWLSKRYPRKARLFFFFSLFRNALVLLILTIAAWLYTRHRQNAKGMYPIQILRTVPSGFKHIGQPIIDHELFYALASQLPLCTIILFLEHIAIGKSFGRLNGYKIDPNQELIAIGVTNTIGSCFGAFPATGSFSRTALKSKSGVRTPAAGIFTAIVVIVALYGLTPAFYWIPTAGLASVIIHAVADLVTSPLQVFSFWRISPFEFFIWVAAVLVTVFSSVENGIYTSVSMSAVILLIRLARPRGSVLGKITLHKEDLHGRKETRDVFVPLESNGINNPRLRVKPPAPEIVIYRFEESYLYPNCSHINTVLVDHVKTNMRRGKDLSTVRPNDRPWNEPGPKDGRYEEERLANERKPILRAIVLDFSQVSHIDTTAVQALIDTRTEVERWTDQPVEFHFATILSPWIRRALVAGGFGIGTRSSSAFSELAAVISDGNDGPEKAEVRMMYLLDVESGTKKVYSRNRDEGGDVFEPAVPIDTPFFHFDLQSAVEAAESSIQRG